MLTIDIVYVVVVYDGAYRCYVTISIAEKASKRVEQNHVDKRLATKQLLRSSLKMENSPAK
jgi:cytidylate kinase